MKKITKTFLAENYQEKPPIREMGETVHMTPLQQALDDASAFKEALDDTSKIFSLEVVVEGWLFWRKTIGYKVTYFE